MTGGKGVQVPFTRSGQSVHMAAEMTEMLLRAVIMDRHTADNDWMEKGNVQLAYCAAIIRYVCGKH
ncbi:unnamed protein product [Gongylonema pulchrum]|uniref:SLH domain-containing protein n=1 Tax=Gongylonema pulchrum TaxID=637853 RepID=A0A183EE76_9BILA|nr:unnamed protein product [Gongylonema pulchrum]